MEPILRCKRSITSYNFYFAYWLQTTDNRVTRCIPHIAGIGKTKKTADHLNGLTFFLFIFPYVAVSHIVNIRSEDASYSLTTCFEELGYLNRKALTGSGKSS